MMSTAGAKWQYTGLQEIRRTNRHAAVSAADVCSS